MRDGLMRVVFLIATVMLVLSCGLTAQAVELFDGHPELYEWEDGGYSVAVLPTDAALPGQLSGGSQTVVPEPSATALLLILLSSGGLVALLRRWRRK